MPGVYGPKGIPVQVPEDEVGDARALAEALLKDMET
jgi:hypothetical protein